MQGSTLMAASTVCFSASVTRSSLLSRMRSANASCTTACWHLSLVYIGSIIATMMAYWLSDAILQNQRPRRYENDAPDVLSAHCYL